MKFKFLSTLKFTLYHIQTFFQNLFLLPLINVSTKSPNRHKKVDIVHNVAIPMRDGIRLYANIYKPDAPGKFPVVLIRMPYGKDEYYCYMPAHGKYWARKGYVCVVQDVRGKWRSEGKWEPFINEANDGYDTLDWIAAEPWCDGNIGMTGESYYGYTQWAVAPLNHPNLKCIAPGDTSANIYGDWIFQDHAFCLQTMGTWALAMDAKKRTNYFRIDPWHLPLSSLGENAKISCDYYKEWIKHPTCDSYWDAINVFKKYAQVRIPVLHWGGWYDEFLNGTLDGWAGVVKEGLDPGNREHQWLLIAPTDHYLSPEITGRIGKVDVGKLAWTYDYIQHFFDYYLKGIDNGLKQEPPIKIFVIGDNQWRYEHEWPLARTVFTKYFFHSQGRANTLHGDGSMNILEPGDEPPDLFQYNPKDPVSVSLFTHRWELAKTLKDRRLVEKRVDVLVYSSSILEKDLEITGPINATIYAASTARDTDFTAVLIDVFPDGYGQLIQEGIIRARYRNPQGEPSLIDPGKIYEYSIDLWATSYVVKAGHSLRVEISSSNFNRYDRNPNTGDEFGLYENVVIADQTMYHTTEFPSHITLPIIPR